MANERLKEFFREKQAKVPDVDWIARRDEWIRAVERLYDSIARDYLGSAEMADIVKVDVARMKDLREPYLGDYSIPELTLSVGDEQVLFSPVGRNVLGAEGRVDVRGDRGEATLVRLPDNRWSLVMSRSPKLQLVPLDDDSFLEMLQRVMR